MYTPGYYRTNYRALRFGEVARMRSGNWIGLPLVYLITRFKKPHGALWLPSFWADTECKKEELSERFWQATAAQRQGFEQLGFTECGCARVLKHLDPNYRDTGGIRYLDSRRGCLGQLIYVRVYIPSPVAVEREQVTIAFTAVFEQGSLSYTNNQKNFDPLPNQTVVRLMSNDVNFIHQRFLQHRQQYPGVPRPFPDVNSFREWFDARQQETFEEWVRRRLVIRMNDDEVEAARSRCQQAPKEPVRPEPAFKIYRGVWLLIVFVVLMLLLLPSRHRGNSDTIEYRGAHFKLSKAYPTYEDYKDDPNNLDTNELDRIEKTMVEAKIPASFKNRKEFIHALFDLRFPGYGLGGIGAESQTDDGSTLEVESLEIPQRDKDRVLVVRESGGRLDLVDDFVYGTATNQIRHVKLEGKKLHYYNGNGALVREKQL